MDVVQGEFYLRLVQSRQPILVRYLSLTAFLTLAFSAWDYLIDPSHWLPNLPLRLAVCLMVLGVLRYRPRQPSPRRFDGMVLLFALCYSVFLVQILGRVEQGLTLGMPCLSVFLTLTSLLLVRSRRAVWLSLVLVAVALASWKGGLHALVLGSHMVVLLMSLVSGAMLARILESSARRQFELESRLAYEASTDPLTGLLNRRACEAQLEQEGERSRRYHRSLTLMLIDIDHFKQFNDTWGHEVGDLVLRHVGGLCQRALRGSDRLGRWGGEEFTAVLPETGLEEGRVLAERLRQTVEQNPYEYQGIPLKVTISLGLAAFREGCTWREACAAADGALYQAKREGRNRWVVREQW